MTGPVNVLRIKPAAGSDPKARPILLVDGRPLEVRIDEEIRRIHGKPWAEKKDALPSIEALIESARSPGEHELLRCGGCGHPGDLGLRFAVRHEGEFVAWTMEHTWYDSPTPFSFRFHAPQYAAEIAKLRPAIPPPSGRGDTR